MLVDDLARHIQKYCYFFFWLATSFSFAKDGRRGRSGGAGALTGQWEDYSTCGG